ncbi:MAG: D-glycero-beta-D-manno-heptose-7-phosphate kinase, partial [Alphaproteobacteria bacterium]|nr:D-glycero-beta-D-manno-heptose-7-phosphate kinase [Alphaproteobacteria bacterium]
MVNRDPVQTDISGNLEKLKDARILVIGDIMLDRFCEGSVSRVSPEAPIPVLHVKRQETHLGGAGNVARNLSSLGARVSLVSCRGEDDAGREITTLLDGMDNVDATLISLKNRPTTIKTRFIAGGQQLLRADWETVMDVAPSEAASILKAAKKYMENAGALILSDYGKGVLSNDIITALIDLAAAVDIPVIVDPKGDDFSCYRGASYVTPNRLELSKASRLPTSNDIEVINAAQHLINSCGIEGVLATRSEEGMSLVLRDENPRHLPARAIEVYDVAGAGDTVIATFAAGLAVDIPAAEAAALANIAAGVVVAKVGTAVAYPDEI